MSTLLVILTLNPTGSQTEFDYLLSHDLQTVTQQGRSPANLLPAADEVVALVTAPALSWHALSLPKGAEAGRTGSTGNKLRTILNGLLEERLLDELDATHLAIGPVATANGRHTVAACAAMSLRQALLELEAAHRPVSRIVPELAPHLGAPEQDELHVMETSSSPKVAWVRSQDVLVLPLDASSAAWLLQQPSLGGVPVNAEPGVAALAEQWFKREARIESAPHRWLLAMRSAWDLAQFDLQNSSQSRQLKKLRQFVLALRTDPLWQPVRWGAMACIVVNLIGLNLWAWHQHSAVQDKQHRLETILTQSFPKVRVVVDPALQMQRELAQLQHASGELGAGDLEALLAAAASSLPPQRSAQSVDFSAGQLRLGGLGLGADELGGVNQRLQGLALRADWRGDELNITTGARP